MCAKLNPMNTNNLPYKLNKHKWDNIICRNIIK